MSDPIKQFLDTLIERGVINTFDGWSKKGDFVAKGEKACFKYMGKHYFGDWQTTVFSDDYDDSRDYGAGGDIY